MDNDNNNNKKNDDDKKKQDESAKASSRRKAPAAKPGAVSVSGQEASRLDQRIEEKRMASESPAVSNKKEPPAALNRMEQDILAKQRAKQERGDQAAGGQTQLASFEADVVAKTRAQAGKPLGQVKPGAVPSGQSQLDSLENDIMAKRKAGAAGPGASAPGVTSVSAGQAQLDSLEHSIAAKTRAAAPGASTASAATSLDDRINAKIRANDSTAKQPPPADGRAQLQSLEDRISAKVNGEAKSPPSYDDEDPLARKMSAADMGASRPSTSLGEMVDSKLASVSGGAAALSGAAKADDKGFAAGATAGFTTAEDDKKGADDEEAALKQSVSGMPPVGGSLLDHSELEYGVYDAAENTEGLAVAVAVEEEDENVFIPAAVEYDPDAKPPMYQNRRFRLYTIVAVVVLVLIAVATGVGIALSRDDDPELTKAQQRKRLGIQEKVESLVGSDKLEESTSPYSQALNWVTVKDPMELLPEDPEFMQRYIMAYIYYATSEKHDWSSCSPPDEDDEEETCIWLDYIQGATDPIFNQRGGETRWLSSKHVCEWAGVVCDSFQQVHKLQLGGMNMTGSFPEGAQFLPHLQFFEMFLGQLRGTIPPIFAKMSHLQRIDFAFNELTGPFPDEDWAQTHVNLVDLRNNKLGGPIPSAIAQLQDLRSLRLSTNLFKGDIPVDFANQQSLRDLHLHRNLFSGTIPTEVGLSHQLGSFSLYENDLQGALPSELGNLPEVNDLSLHNNQRLGGEIPEGIYRDNKLLTISLYNCNITGTISDAIAESTRLFTFAVQNNNLHGTIPAAVSTLTSLQQFSIQGNPKIVGEISDEFCSLRTEAQLDELEANCLAPEDGGTPNVLCDCCDTCCDSNGENCIDV